MVPNARMYIYMNERAWRVYFYTFKALFLHVGKIIKSVISAAGVFLLTSSLSLSNPNVKSIENSFAQNQKSQKPKTEQVQKEQTSQEKEKYLKDLSSMMKQGWEKAQEDFKAYHNLKTPGRFKATFMQNIKNDDFESLFYLLNDSTLIAINILTKNSVGIQIEPFSTNNQTEKTQLLSKDQVNELMAFAYLELLSQELGLEGMNLFGSTDISSLYSRRYNRKETNRQCFSKGEPIVAFFSLIFEKQNMDFLKAYIEQDFDKMQSVLDSYLGQNTRMHLLSYTDKYSSLFEAFVDEVARNGLLVELVEYMQNKFQSDPIELSLAWDEKTQEFINLNYRYKQLKNHQK